MAIKNKKSVSYFKKRIGLRISKYYRELTSADRVLPNYIIIGVQKGGTSSLFRYLTQHPNVLAGYKKEVKFFDGNYHKGLNWYRYNFPLISQMSDRLIQTGEASPSYVFHPLVPQRIKEALPNIKLVLLLRDPVARAYSHYHGNLRKGQEKASFQEAIEQEENRLNGEREKIIADQKYPMYRYLVYSYLARGVYIDQVKNWFKSFPRDQILILKSEDFFNNPPEVYQRVLTFLRLPDWKLQNFEIFNTGDYEKMDPSIEEKLRAYFDPLNQELYEYLGTNFNWGSL
jgi:hypothetical protein